MANAKTTKKREAEMRKLCQGCSRDPNTCVHLQFRQYKNACIWRMPR
jgi:hypothetical protein